MQLATVHKFVEELRVAAIGEPEWIAEKEVYEYKEQTPKVVAILKLVRAAHGLTAIHNLLYAGLFIDFGTIIRCIGDALDEAAFLLEDYPKSSTNVEKFAKAFFASTIDGYLSDEIQPVPTSKIRAAVVRSLKGEHDDPTQKMKERVYKTFCGYVHANCAHIMEVYGGKKRSFYLGGEALTDESNWRFEYLALLNGDVLTSSGLCAFKLGLNDIGSRIIKALDEGEISK